MDKGLLKRALADTAEPTPGYMFRDITQWTFLDHTTQTKLVSALTERLQPNATVHVLAKTLKLVKHLCEAGHTAFQKEIQRKSEILKEFANYRGKQDPKFGDTLNQKVRTSAKEAVDAAFAPRKESKIVIDSQGSDATWKEEKSGFSTGGKTSGSKSGDPHMAEMPTTNKWQEHMDKGGGKVKADDNQFVKQIKQGWNTGFGMRQEGIKSAEQRMTENLSNTGGYQAIDLGGGFSQSEETSGGSGGGWKFTEETSGASSAAAMPKEVTRMVTPLQREVERLAAFKNTPQRVEVTQFIETVWEIIEQGGQSFEDLAEVMDQNLAQKNPWQARLNVLCAVESIARSNRAPDFNAYFIENPEDIQRNVHVVQSSLKEKASKVLKILNIPERTTQSTTSAPSAGTTEAKQSTNFSGDTTWSAPVQTSAFGGGGDEGGADFEGMSETVPRRKKADKAGKDKTGTLKKRATAQAQQDDGTSDNWGGGWGEQPSNGGGWGAQPTSNNNGGGWGDNGNSGFGGGGGDGGWNAQPQQPPQQQQAPPPAPAPAPPQAKPAQDLDAFFGPGDVQLQSSAPPAQQQSQPWGAEPQTGPAGPWGQTSEPAQQQQQQQQQQAPPPAQASTFDPLSLPPPPQAQQAPAPAPAQPAVNPQQMQMMQQMMTTLNSQMQQLMANAANNPNATAQVQQLMQQQQQLMQQLTAMQSQAAQQPPAAPQQQQPPQQGYSQSAAQQQYQQELQQREQQKRANDQFAFAEQAMKHQFQK